MPLHQSLALTRVWDMTVDINTVLADLGVSAVEDVSMPTRNRRDIRRGVTAYRRYERVSGNPDARTP